MLLAGDNGGQSNSGVQKLSTKGGGQIHLDSQSTMRMHKSDVQENSEMVEKAEIRCKLVCFEKAANLKLLLPGVKYRE